MPRCLVVSQHSRGPGIFKFNKILLSTSDKSSPSTLMSGTNSHQMLPLLYRYNSGTIFTYLDPCGLLNKTTRVIYPRYKAHFDSFTFLLSTNY
uniref:Uncharacterized protein n=1 Tax=Arundo donax TaxID=35708 RepID=A0A0A8YEH9_ARUDO